MNKKKFERKLALIHVKMSKVYHELYVLMRDCGYDGEAYEHKQSRDYHVWAARDCKRHAK